MFSSRVGGFELEFKIRFSVWVVRGNAHVFQLVVSVAANGICCEEQVRWTVGWRLILRRCQRCVVTGVLMRRL